VKVGAADEQVAGGRNNDNRYRAIIISWHFLGFPAKEETESVNVNILVMAPQPFYIERGTPIAVGLLLHALCEAGHKVDLLTYPEGKDVEIDGLRIYRVRKVPFIKHVPIGLSWQKLVYDFLMIFRMFGLARSNRYQVIHAVEESMYIASMMLPFGSTRLVYDMDSSMADQLIEKWKMLRLLSPVFNWFERFAVKRSDVVLPVCKALAEKVHRHCPDRKMYVLEDVALESDEQPDSAEDIGSDLGIDGLMAVYVGNLEHYQGIDLLLQAMDQLQTEPALHLVIIGGSPEDVRNYRIKAEQMGLSGSVHFLGPRPVGQLMYYLKQADILVSPRIKGENTPMKIYSYMASGKPVLATEIDSHTQVLDSGCACLVKADGASIAFGLKTLVDSEEMRDRLGKAAAARAAANHTYDAFRAKLLDAYSYLDSL
jgi:glycosyltransferase involved in cell wall biosynthesis